MERKRVAELMERESLSRSIMASLAAKCVRQRFSGYDEGEWRASKDFEKASRYALELNDGDSQSAGLFMSWLEQKTDVLISKLWPEICAIASGLPEHGRLTGEQVRGIIARTRAKQSATAQHERATA